MRYGENPNQFLENATIISYTLSLPKTQAFKNHQQPKLRCSIPLLCIQVNLEVEILCTNVGRWEEEGGYEENTNQGNLSNFRLD